jgi:hypothetical protein
MTNTEKVKKLVELFKEAEEMFPKGFIGMTIHHIKFEDLPLELFPNMHNLKGVGLVAKVNGESSTSNMTVFVDQEK